MSSSRVGFAWVAATTLFMFAMSVGTQYPEQLRLQNLPVIFLLVGLAGLAWAGRGSRCAITCIHLFLWLHIFGARWIYTYVPYDSWTQSVFGTSLSEAFDWNRNHYDRFVHFASGVLFVPPAFEWLRYRQVRVLDAAILSVCIVLALGAGYEILEWCLAIVLAPAQAEAYNGQQGDAWDPQKDMALAWTGATLCAIVLYASGGRRRGDRRFSDSVSLDSAR